MHLLDKRTSESILKCVPDFGRLQKVDRLRLQTERCVQSSPPVDSPNSRMTEETGADEAG